MCFFGGGGGAPGPQSSADKAKGGYVPPTSGQVSNAGNPHNDAATPQGKKTAIQNQQTADRNTMRRAGQTSAVASGQKTMNALNDYNKANKKTILGS
jgi:hypothetical protein